MEDKKEGFSLISWAEAEEVLRSGKAIGYPTDTVWGIGCVADDEEAVKKCLAHKGEGRTPICSAIIPSLESMAEYVDIDKLPEQAQLAVRSCLPGPYTFILPLKNENLKHIAGPGPTLGIRIIPDPHLMRLVKTVNRPLLTTSLNITKEPTASNFDEAKVTAKKMGIACIDTSIGSYSNDDSQSQNSPVSCTTEDPNNSSKATTEQTPLAGVSSTVLKWDAESNKFQVIRQGSGKITDELLAAGVEVQ